MSNLWIADIKCFEGPDGTLLRGCSAQSVRFLGEIVSAGSVLTVGDFQISSLCCRKKPNHKRCPGKIRLGRNTETDDIHWSCTVCDDRGAIINWHHSRWDLSLDLKMGQIVSLSAERARRGIQSSPLQKLLLYELEVELVHAPLPIEGQVSRRIRLSSDHKLQDLHACIHSSYDRLTEEPYGFMFGAPYEPDTRRLTGPANASEEDYGLWETQVARLDAFNLKSGQTFGYLFDFADMWVHRVTVLSAREITGRSSPPEVVDRVGESPPQYSVPEEEFDEQLLWGELDAPYPLSNLYGPYLADEGPHSEDWLSLDDIERQLLIIEAHTTSLPAGHPRVESMLLHSVIHDLAETRLAEMPAKKAKELLQSHPARKAGRHVVIHQLGEQLIYQLLSQSTLRAPEGKKHRQKPPYSATDAPPTLGK